MSSLPLPPKLTPLAESLPASVPFIGPEAIERRLGRPLRARIGANESGFGPSPAVIAAMRAAAPGVWRYGDPEVFELRRAIAAHLGLPAANIAVGEGIDGLLGLICRLFIGPGDVALAALGTYPTFGYHVAGFGGRLVTVPYAGYVPDLDRLLDTARAERNRLKLIYLANPDNPMGVWFDPDTLRRFIDAVDDNVLVVLDEAYCETLDAGDRLPLAYAPANLIHTRTFSKAYGLAGLRVGYAIGPGELVAAFDKVRNHFGLGRLSQVAALAALADADWLADVLRRMSAGRIRLQAIAADNGLQAVPSATNFVTMDCRRGGSYALAVLQALESRGIFIRKPMAPILDSCIRISVGPPHELDQLAEELPRALRAAESRTDVL